MSMRLLLTLLGLLAMLMFSNFFLVAAVVYLVFYGLLIKFTGTEEIWFTAVWDELMERK